MLSKHQVFFEGSPPLSIREVADFMPQEDVPMEQVPMEPVPMEEAPAGDQVTNNIQDDFQSSKSTSQDYRDAEKIADSYSDEVVIMAAMRVFRLRGRTASYQVVKAIMDDEDLAETLHKVIKDTTKDSRSLTPEEGLSHLHARDWSKEDWNVSIALIDSNPPESKVT